MKQVTIDRQRWGRGKTGGKLADRNRQNCCCLSFVSNQLYGVSWNDMRCKSMPSSVKNVDPTRCPLLVQKGDFNHGISTDLAGDASGVNDSVTTSDQSKESRIIALFAKAGIKIVFTGRRRKE